MEQAIKNPIIRDCSKIVCEELKEITLDGDTPQRVVSADGYDLIYRIPGALRGKSLVRPPSCHVRLTIHDNIADCCFDPLELSLLSRCLREYGWHTTT